MEIYLKSSWNSYEIPIEFLYINGNVVEIQLKFQSNWNLYEIPIKIDWKSNSNLSEIRMKISTKHKWKSVKYQVTSIGNPVEMPSKIHWKSSNLSKIPMEIHWKFSLNLFEIPMDISMKYLWKSIGKKNLKFQWYPLGIKLKL